MVFKTKTFVISGMCSYIFRLNAVSAAFFFLFHEIFVLKLYDHVTPAAVLQIKADHENSSVMLLVTVIDWT